MLVIGITGTLGAGKGTIVDYLVDSKGFAHYSVRAYLIEEIKKREPPCKSRQHGGGCQQPPAASFPVFYH